ncbi:MAG TPA: hypothetical protein VFR85_13850 [Anaeromyxobacteraceae bacterium]|nr:hypothetical protein [Anaeromyxobacteraceae bacterium]
MRRSRLVAAALLLAAACPLPQSVPSVPPGSVTPPRIVQDTSRPDATSLTLTTSGTATAFDGTCTTPQAFTISATVADENPDENVDFRWFVDYSPIDPARYTYLPESGQLGTPTQEPFNLRPVPNLTPFRPASYGGTAVHVLELVASNGFDKSADQAARPLPYRTPLSGYEVQSHKWVFVPTPGCAAAATCPPCPP